MKEYQLTTEYEYNWVDIPLTSILSRNEIVDKTILKNIFLILDLRIESDRDYYISGTKSSKYQHD